MSYNMRPARTSCRKQPILCLGSGCSRNSILADGTFHLLRSHNLCLYMPIINLAYSEEAVRFNYLCALSRGSVQAGQMRLSCVNSNGKDGPCSSSVTAGGTRSNAQERERETGTGLGKMGSRRPVTEHRSSFCKPRTICIETGSRRFHLNGEDDGSRCDCGLAGRGRAKSSPDSRRKVKNGSQEQMAGGWSQGELHLISLPQSPDIQIIRLQPSIIASPRRWLAVALIVMPQTCSASSRLTTSRPHTCL